MAAASSQPPQLPGYPAASPVGWGERPRGARVGLSPVAGGEPNIRVPASSPAAAVSGTRGVPSPLQKFSESGKSCRHFGQRFIGLGG
jgi:hypothetical protein